MRYSNSKSIVIWNFCCCLHLLLQCLLFSIAGAGSVWISGWIVVCFYVFFIDLLVVLSVSRLCLIVCDYWGLGVGSVLVHDWWFFDEYNFFVLLFSLCGIQISFNINFDFFVNLIWGLSGCLGNLIFDWNLKIYPNALGLSLSQYIYILKSL